MNEFDIKAAGWDANPLHRDRSEAIVSAMRARLPLNSGMTALEYGAGTGIASFLLKDDLKEIILMDNSSEMVRITREKIESSGASNLKVLNFDLEHNDYTKGKFDLIFSQMVLHHVADAAGILKKFGNLLNSGGHLAIADLYPEDGSFHGDGFTGHKGFDPEVLATSLRSFGFTDVAHSSCFQIEHKISDTESRLFEVFLLTASVR